MSGIETRFAADDDADQIRAAFYGFVERHADDAGLEGGARISTEIGAQGPKLRVRLWSVEAMDSFLSGLSGALSPDRRRCFE